MAHKAHPTQQNQRRASARKLANRRTTLTELLEEARQRGMSLFDLKQEKHEVVQEIRRVGRPTPSWLNKESR